MNSIAALGDSDFGCGKAAVAQMKTAGEISIICHEDEVPDFVEAELERLYGSVFSSLAQFSVYGGAEHASTYVARRGGEATSVLLFRRERQHVRVINEWITLDADEIARFAAHVFITYEAVNVITFPAVRTAIRHFPFPFQRFACTDDNVVALPATADAYLAQLGKATRRNIRRYFDRLTQDFPSFRYRTYAQHEVSGQLVRDIIALNRLRMAGKNKVSGIDGMETQRIIRLAKMKGFVVAATIDGRVCAGAITYRLGENYFSFVRAHDPRFDAYRLGLVCGYLLVSECIGRGGKELHLMWGREQHKSLLRGMHTVLERLTIYRSPMQVLLNAGTAFSNVGSGCVRRTQACYELLWRLRKPRITEAGDAGTARRGHT